MSTGHLLPGNGDIPRFMQDGSKGKAIFIVLALTCVSSSGFGASYSAEILTDDPISWWRFEDAISTNGATASDSMGSFNGVYSGDVIFNVGIPGAGGQSARFDGNSDSVAIGDVGPLPVAGSVEFWMYSESVANYRNPFTTGPLGSFATGNRAIRFEENSAGQFVIAIGNDAATSPPQYVNAIITGMETGKWYHVVTTWNTSLSRVSAFINNVPVLVDDLNVDWPSRLSSVTIGIGWASLSERSWLGRVDEVAIYDFELDTVRVDAHYTAGVLAGLNDLQISLQNGNSIRLEMSGTANKNYLVSASEDLLLFNPIASLAADSLGDVIFDDEEANQFSKRFYVIEDLSEITALWDGGGDGVSWNDALNWSGNIVPGEFDNVLIDVSVDETTIVHPSGDTIVNSLQLIGNFDLSGGTLTVLANSVIDGDLTVGADREIIADGNNLNFSVTGAAAIDQARITAANGATISMPAATSFQSGILTISGGTVELPALTNIDLSLFNLSDGASFMLPATVTGYDSSGGMGTNEQRTVFSADGAGTVLDLSPLESMLSNFSGLGGLLQLVSATNGGTIDLSGLQTVDGGGSGANGGGPLEYRADAGSSINLTSLSSVTGTGAGVFLNFALSNFTLPQLAVASNVTLEIPDGGTLNLPLLPSLSDSAVVIDDGETLNTPLLTEFTNSTLIMDGTANFQRSVFTDVDHSRFILSGGAVFALPASLTNYDSSGGMGTNEQRAVFSADGVGTLLDLSSLETMNSDFSGLGGLLQLVSASDGGTVDLSGMQTINGGGSGVNGGGPLEFRAESGSSIDLSSLTTVTGTGAGVFFNASGSLSLGVGTTSVTNARVETAVGGSITVGTLELSTDSSMAGNGTIMGNVLNGAIIEPGLSAGTLTIDGAYTQSSTGTVEIEIGGLIPGDDFDQLIVLGIASLAGALRVTLIESFEPVDGNPFKVLKWNSSSGNFDSLLGLDVGGGVALDPLYNTLDFTLLTVTTSGIP